MAALEEEEEEEEDEDEEEADGRGSCSLRKSSTYCSQDSFGGSTTGKS